MKREDDRKNSTRGEDNIEIQKEEERGEDRDRRFLVMRVLEIPAVGRGSS